MSSNPELPVPRPAQPISLDPSLTSGAGSASLWDRISAWAAEHKAVVYTIAGATVLVTGAGAVYYFSGDSTSKKAESAKAKKNRKQKERKRAKQAADEAAAKEAEAAGMRPLMCIGVV